MLQADLIGTIAFASLAILIHHAVNALLAQARVVVYVLRREFAVALQQNLYRQQCEGYCHYSEADKH